LPNTLSRFARDVGSPLLANDFILDRIENVSIEPYPRLEHNFMIFNYFHFCLCIR
jgi:hypothetical protein